ncbi:DUF4115 domain-containing protein [Pseudooceanicola sp. CBS1P-1]|uniref:DUF4115 domain-containing protein n=1 Tax=Pseudooceanicola albus TaxID=2692189 RepID=A0A6L7G0K1_9RHOB|nr:MULTISPECIES: RodZ domain-containing protein [Pseudooceanicola]MBT9382415.1 DUF4115 domain-containing protein [Pseudooceanicola endophyticus]MXN16956.1 DUF4115 domain-containing protein [Pseudooceanicola albus]
MRRKKKPVGDQAVRQPRGYDDFEVKLGDVMRGERATMGKSLLDVQRELRIKANYISAIENCDPEAFDTPGFISGYVRSYARYLNMDAEATFRQFCRESGFAPAHGMAAEASSRPRPDRKEAPRKPSPRDPFLAPETPFIPAGESWFSRIEPAAIGSALVLIALICGLGYGGYAVLNEVQRVKFAPVESTPDVLADLDPLEAATHPSDDPVADEQKAAGLYNAPADSMYRLYRPQALDVPVVASRDAPIATLNPAQIGTFVGKDPSTTDLVAEAAPASGGSVEDKAVAVALGLQADGKPVPQPQVVADAKPGVSLVAVRPAWVRVTSADGTVLLEKTMTAGESYALPNTEEPAHLRAGMSGSVYFAVNGKLYGPAGKGTSVVKNVALSADQLEDNYKVADLSADPTAQKVISVVAEADLPQDRQSD